jgi:diguanylate cyclase (GGDEF)-like protein/PAS domain S-box-containing protein
MKNQEKRQKTHFSKYTFSLFFENYPHTVIEVSPDGSIFNANPASSKIFKTEPIELKKHSLFDYFVPEEKEKIINYLKKQSGNIKAKLKLQKQFITPIELTFNRINNPELKTLLIHLKILEQEKTINYKDAEKLFLHEKDILPAAESQITELKALNKNLQNELNYLRKELIQTKKSEKKLGDLTEMLPEIVFEMDKDGRLTFMNQRGIKLLGYDREELLNRMTIWQIISHPGTHIITSELKELFQKRNTYPQECYLVGKDQIKIPAEVHVSPIENDAGELTGFRGIILDITMRKEYEDKIKYLSFHDKLTGLYNRAYFEEELKRLNNKRKLPISIIIGDVNNLKMINDSFGHQHGDNLLRKIAGVLKSCFRKSDVISRWGGDEYSIILPNTTLEKGNEIITRIGKECQKKSTLTLPLSISMGIATKNSMTENIHGIVREAESKMYRNKLIDKQITGNSVITSLEKALQQRKYETKEYRQSFIDCAARFGKVLKLEEKEMKDLRLLAMISDIGKIAISEEIILKKGWLSETEWEEVKKHPEIGFRIARSSTELAHIADAILYHHEFWDGNGYPQKIKGEEIPLLSRIIHIVNAYQAMIHERPYRRAMSKEDAITELEKGKGSQFDPELMEKFVAMVT